MIIHTVSEGETPYGIARKYGIPVTKLLCDNGIEGDRLIAGEELAVIMPTRTVTVGGTDTIQKIAARFRIRPSYILAANPQLKGVRKLSPGQLLTVKQDVPKLGCASAIGYVHDGISAENLTRSLPYITYYLICAAKMHDGGISEIFYPSDISHTLKAEGKFPILCILDTTGGAYLSDGAAAEKLISLMIDAARSGGFAGVCLRSPYSNDKSFPSFVMLARRGFIGSGLIFFTEVDSNGHDAAELSDGAILKGVFDKDEDVILRFSEVAESSKIFIMLDCDCKLGDKVISYNDARRLCIRSGKRFSPQSDGISNGFVHTVYKRGIGQNKEVLCPSLEYIKAKLSEISELGYMGIAVNVNNVPTVIYSVFNALFSRADYGAAQPM